MIITPKDKYMALFGYTGGNNKYCYTLGLINRWWSWGMSSRLEDGHKFYSIDFGVGYLELQIFGRSEFNDSEQFEENPAETIH